MNAKQPLDPHEIQLLVDYCRAHLDLTHLKQSDDYGYTNLPLSVIDAVFSIGVHYISTANTVNRFREYASTRRPDTTEFSVNDFVQLYDETSVEFMARDVYKNL